MQGFSNGTYGLDPGRLTLHRVYIWILFSCSADALLAATEMPDGTQGTRPCSFCLPLTGLFEEK